MGSGIEFKDKIALYCCSSKMKFKQGFTCFSITLKVLMKE